MFSLNFNFNWAAKNCPFLYYFLFFFHSILISNILIFTWEFCFFSRNYITIDKSSKIYQSRWFQFSDVPRCVRSWFIFNELACDVDDGVDCGDDYNNASDFIWSTHHSFGYSYIAVEEFHCWLWMVSTIVYRHWFEALNYFPLVSWPLDYWHVYGYHQPLNHHCHRFYPKMLPNCCHSMNSSRSIAEYYFVAKDTDCRGRLKKLDWFADHFKWKTRCKWIKTVNNDRIFRTIVDIYI